MPLARVQELLDASPEAFADGIQEIDKDLRAQIRRLQDTRRRLARLATGEHLALPQSVVDYLDRLRGLGVEERYIELERDAWIMVAAQVPQPHLIDAVIAKKHEELDDPDMVKLYSFLRGALDWPAEDPRVFEVADILERLMIRAVTGQLARILEVLTCCVRRRGHTGQGRSQAIGSVRHGSGRCDCLRERVPVRSDWLRMRHGVSGARNSPATRR